MGCPCIPYETILWTAAKENTKHSIQTRVSQLDLELISQSYLQIIFVSPHSCIVNMVTSSNRVIFIYVVLISDDVCQSSGSFLTLFYYAVFYDAIVTWSIQIISFQFILMLYWDTKGKITQFFLIKVCQIFHYATRSGRNLWQFYITT